MTLQLDSSRGTLDDLTQRGDDFLVVLRLGLRPHLGEQLHQPDTRRLRELSNRRRGIAQLWMLS